MWRCGGYGVELAIKISEVRVLAIPLLTTLRRLLYNSAPVKAR